jgi:hypothetical protein
MLQKVIIMKTICLISCSETKCKNEKIAEHFYTSENFIVPKFRGHHA